MTNLSRLGFTIIVTAVGSGWEWRIFESSGPLLTDSGADGEYAIFASPQRAWADAAKVATAYLDDRAEG
jgi:hypothetical protein